MIDQKINWAMWKTRLPNEADQLRAIELMKQSGCKTRSDFIRSRLLDEKFKVFYADTNLQKVITLQEQILFEINKIGVNYNQITRKINSTHGVKGGAVLMKQVEEAYSQLLELCGYASDLLEQVKAYKEQDHKS